LISTDISGLVGILDKSSYLPYMPAQQIKPAINYNSKIKKTVPFNFYVENKTVLTQKLTANNEKPTPGYWLLNAGIGLTWVKNTVTYEFSVAGNNLLNQFYYDHLSRLKTYGIYNMGRNITFNIKIKFVKPIKN
jgi:iron complex outermembrane receptor protein